MTKIQYEFKLEKGSIILNTLDEARVIRNKINQPYKTEYVPIEPEEPATGWKTLSPNMTK